MIYLELAIVVVLILINGILAMAELAVVSSRRARLQVLVEREVVGARRALALAADPGRFLSTVQIGITLVGVLSGAFSGATLGLRLVEWLVSLGMAARIADYLGVGVVVALITYASLIVGELVPKQIALHNPEGIAVRVAPAMTWLARLGAPLVSLLDVSGDLVLRLLRYQPEAERKVTEEEVRTLIAEAETAGVIEPDERAMISSVLRLGDRPVRAVMTPRRAVDTIDLSLSRDEIRARIAASPHSRLPVHAGDGEEIIGVVQAKELLDAFIRGEDPDVTHYVRPAPVIPDTADALDVVDTIRRAAAHVALIHDEYGHFEGIVTNADVLQAIIGTPTMPDGAAEPDAVQRTDGSWLIAGSMSADALAELLAIELPADRSYQTAAGFVLGKFGHLPAIGESFEASGWRFEVVDLDGRRIDKLLVTRLGRRRG